MGTRLRCFCSVVASCSSARRTSRCHLRTRHMSWHRHRSLGECGRTDTSGRLRGESCRPAQSPWPSPERDRTLVRTRLAADRFQHSGYGRWHAAATVRESRVEVVDDPPAFNGIEPPPNSRRSSIIVFPEFRPARIATRVIRRARREVRVAGCSTTTGWWECNGFWVSTWPGARAEMALLSTYQGLRLPTVRPGFAPQKVR